MNEVAHQAIVRLLEDHNIKLVSLDHPPSKTSEESEIVRANAGYPNVMGAKALLTKLYFKDGERYATIVLPGTHILDRGKLIGQIPNLKKIRFVTPEEMTKLAGVIPGCMPPFAAPIFPDIPVLIIASALRAYDQLGFNAAYLEKSILLPAADYFSVVHPTFEVDCSVPKERTNV